MQVPELYDELMRGVERARALPWRPWRRRIAVYLTVPHIVLGHGDWVRTWSSVQALPGPPPLYGYTIRQALQIATFLTERMSGYDERVRRMTDDTIT